MTAPKRCSGTVLKAGDGWIRVCSCHYGDPAIAFRTDTFGRPLVRNVP